MKGGIIMKGYGLVKKAFFVAYNLFLFLTAAFNLFDMSKQAYRWLAGVAALHLIFLNIFMPTPVYRFEQVLKDNEEKKISDEKVQ